SVSTFTLNFGTFLADGSTITVTNSLTISSGTFDGKVSSITVGGDFLANDGILQDTNAVYSVAGNFKMSVDVPAMDTPAHVNLTGAGKSLSIAGDCNGSGQAFSFLTITGSVTNLSAHLCVNNAMDVSGTFTVTSGVNSLWIHNGSTLTVTGSI